jgi:hypothetical protein
MNTLWSLFSSLLNPDKEGDTSWVVNNSRKHFHSLYPSLEMARTLLMHRRQIVGQLPIHYFMRILGIDAP